MYAIELPEAFANTLVSRCWDLGDIFITQGAADLLDEANIDVRVFLLRHWAGDYGLISEDEIDSQRNQVAREEGRKFFSLFSDEEDCFKVVTVPSLNRTVVCLTRED